MVVPRPKIQLADTPSGRNTHTTPVAGWQKIISNQFRRPAYATVQPGLISSSGTGNGTPASNLR